MAQWTQCAYQPPSNDHSPDGNMASFECNFSLFFIWFLILRYKKHVKNNGFWSNLPNFIYFIVFRKMLGNIFGHFWMWPLICRGQKYEILSKSGRQLPNIFSKKCSENCKIYFFCKLDQNALFAIWFFISDYQKTM